MSTDAETEAPIEEQIRRIAPQLSHEEAHAIARLFPPERPKSTPPADALAD